MLHSVVQWLVETVSALGYPGIAALMAIESSFIPLPSEVVMPPAGYLAAQGRMDPVLAVLAGTLGSVIGALFNYWFAIVIGEPFKKLAGSLQKIRQTLLFMQPANERDCPTTMRNSKLGQRNGVDPIDGI